jgi:putative membrane protein
MDRSPVLREARIKPQVIRYHLVGVTILLLFTIVGIIALPIVLPLAYWAMSRYYARLKVILTRRDLKVHRGIFQREEKSIPLEKITDLAVYQGPIMRMFDIKGIRVETAGQSSQGALVVVVGIEDVDAFRDAVLDQRDRVSERDAAASEATHAAATPSHAGSEGTQMLLVLTQIRDSLARLEQAVADRRNK